MVVVACGANAKHILTFVAQEEPERASERGAEWPRYGGCVVARARTHARSWRKKHGAAGTGLGTAFTHYKGLA